MTRASTWFMIIEIEGEDAGNYTSSVAVNEKAFTSVVSSKRRNVKIRVGKDITHVGRLRRPIAGIAAVLHDTQCINPKELYFCSESDDYRIFECLR